MKHVRGLRTRRRAARAERAQVADGAAPSGAESGDAASSGAIVVPGRNAWRVERAERFRCVQDGEEYFRLVREAILRARRSIFILGWDIAAKVDLLPGASDERAPTQLGALLDHVVRANRRLHCYVLIWSGSAVYRLERDPFTKLRLGWGTHRRVHFRFDNDHPFGASHHQKIVVVDDRLAFSGGLDLTGHRWDTPEHELENPLRTNIRGVPYTPFHDVQALVEGPVAASLAEIARVRWRRSGRRGRVPAIAPAQHELWPASVEPDLVDVDVAISRTEPHFRGRPAVRECAALFVDSIAAARRTIYVENQYFTSQRVADALAARLREADGPEVILVGPKQCEGWLEENTMGALRQQVLVKLLDADLHGRLRLLHAVASRSAEVCTFIHAKVMVVDDELLRIGSANLSNRSSGVDTECDLAVEARGDARVRRGIAHVRDRLVGEHLGANAAEVRRALEEHGSLRAVVDAWSGRERALEQIEVDREAEVSTVEVVMQVADPTEPMNVTRSFDQLLPEVVAEERRPWHFALALQLCGVVVTGLVAWHRVRMEELLQQHGENLASIALAPLLFALLSLAFVPTEVLTLAAALMFGTWIAAAVVFVAMALSAAAGYAIGRALGAGRVASIVDQRAYALVRELRSRGATTVALLRLLPLASTMTIHLVSGAARVPVREYALGTLIGWAPGALALLVLGGLLRRTLLEPSLGHALATVAVGVVLALVLLRRRRVLVRRHVEQAEEEQAERARFG